MLNVLVYRLKTFLCFSCIFFSEPVFNTSICLFYLFSNSSWAMCWWLFWLVTSARNSHLRCRLPGRRWWLGWPTLCPTSTTEPSTCPAILCVPYYIFLHMRNGLILENTDCLIKIIHPSNQKVIFVLSIFYFSAKEKCLMGLWERGIQEDTRVSLKTGRTQERRVDAIEGFYWPRESL